MVCTACLHPRCAESAWLHVVLRRSQAALTDAARQAIQTLELRAETCVAVLSGPGRARDCDAVALNLRTTTTCLENAMGLGTILLIVLILMLVGAIPAWGHSKSWGYAPSGGIGLVVVIVAVLLLMGRL
jgi:hypothetical protein